MIRPSRKIRSIFHSNQSNRKIWLNWKLLCLCAVCTRLLLLCVCLRVFVYSHAFVMCLFTCVCVLARFCYVFVYVCLCTRALFLMKSRVAYCLSRDLIKHSYKLVFLFCIYVCLQLCSQSEQFFLKYSTVGLGFNEAK